MSQDFPTYGRGDTPPEQPPPSVPPAEPYASQPQYGAPQPDTPPQGAPSQGAPSEGAPAQGPEQGTPPGAGSSHGPRQPSAQPGYPGAPGQFGQRPPASYPAPGPSTHGAQGQPPYGNQPPYGGQPGYGNQPGYGQTPYAHQAGPPPEPNPKAARIALIAGIVTAFYALLVLSIQRTSLREISQAPGSTLNHPLRTDVVDALGQLGVTALAGTALVLWVRDLLDRQRKGHRPEAAELVGLGLVALSVIFVLVWILIVASTGFGSTDASIDRLPTAYGYGGFGLLLLAAGMFVAFRTLRPPISNPVVLDAPAQPPWA